MSHHVIHDAYVLLSITLIAGICLSFAYEWTREPIRKAQAARRAEAYTAVMPEAVSFRPYEDDEFFHNVAINFPDIGFSDVTIAEIFQAVDQEGNILGFVLRLISDDGHNGDMAVAIGVRLNGVLAGVTILADREAQGIDPRYYDREFLSQFSELNTLGVMIGTPPNERYTQVYGISGDAETTRALLQAVNAGLYAAHHWLTA